jgi:hypothetical protein
VWDGGRLPRSQGDWVYGFIHDEILVLPEENAEKKAKQIE